MDKNPRYHRNLKKRKIAIVVIGRRSTAPLQRLVTAVDAVAPGSYVEVAFLTSIERALGRIKEVGPEATI